MSGVPSFKDRLRTVDERGNRLTVFAEIFTGEWRKKRRVVAYFLIILFVILPFIRINNIPFFQIDVLHQRLMLFGNIFWFHEAGFFIPIILGVALLIYASTAWAGRVFCGWVCPQTVYLEFIFRPIEAWLEGNKASNHKAFKARPVDFDKILRVLVKWLLYFIFSFLIANIFLSYFIGSSELFEVIRNNPSVNPGMFAVVCFVTAGFVFNFGWFREQMCTITCPYGRLQGVLLDRRSTLVAYDYNRGEPRGKGKGGACIDCGRCVQVCPTGIDIRDGTQLECINCMACIDACNDVMRKIHREPNLVRRTSEAELADKIKQTRFIPVRSLIYFSLVAMLFSLAGFQAYNRLNFDVTNLRSGAVSFQTVGNKIENHVRLKINNKFSALATFHFSSGDKAVEVIAPQNGYQVQANDEYTFELFIDLNKESFKNGIAHVTIAVVADSNQKEESKNVDLTLFGPM